MVADARHGENGVGLAFAFHRERLTRFQRECIGNFHVDPSRNQDLVRSGGRHQPRREVDIIAERRKGLT
jgi:hypothetical protein